MGQTQSSQLLEFETKKSRSLAHKLRAARERRSKEKERRGAEAPAAAPASPACAAADGADLPPMGAAAYPGAPFRPDLSGPPVPACEAQRLQFIESLDLLDSPPAPELENILTLISGIFGTKAALIALFGDRRIWVMSGKNFQAGDFPWRLSFCGWSMATETAVAMVVPNAHIDARFANHPYVKAGQVGFYAGTPLIASNGHRMGTLCCADPTPREFDDHQCQVLNNFAAVVSAELEKSARVAAGGKKMSATVRQQIAETVEGAGGCALCVTAAAGRGLAVVHANKEIGELVGTPGIELLGRSLWSLFDPAGPNAAPEAGQTIARDAARAAAEGRSFALRGVRLAGNPAEAFDLTFRPVGSHSVVSGAQVAVPAFLPDAPDSAPKDDVYFVSVERPAGAAQSGGPDRRSLDSVASTIDFSVSEVAWSGAGSSASRGLASSCGASSRGGGAPSEGVARCPIEGLKVGAPLASGSYGRVYRGRYFGSRVAVKVLEAEAVLRRDPETGVTLEAVLSRALSHPNIVATLAWRIVHGQAQMPKPAAQLVGESLGAPAPAKGPSGAPRSAALRASAAPAAPSSVDGDSLAASLSGALSLAGTPPPPPGSSGGSSGALSAPRNCDSSGGSLASGWERDREEGQTWIVLEFCDKGCLQDAVDRGWLRVGRTYGGEPDLLSVLSTAREIASAMVYLHSMGVVHGDLSAFNVLLTSASTDAAVGGRGFVAKVSDFGLARVLDHRSRVETATYGTLTHMAPEVLEHGIISKAADVYSFGVLLWQMCCGSRPWAGISHAAVVRAVVQERRCLEFGDEAPEGVALLAAACMARDPAERPTFREVVEVLEPLGEVVAQAAAEALAADE